LYCIILVWVFFLQLYNTMILEQCSCKVTGNGYNSRFHRTMSTNIKCNQIIIVAISLLISLKFELNWNFTCTLLMKVSLTILSFLGSRKKIFYKYIKKIFNHIFVTKHNRVFWNTYWWLNWNLYFSNQIVNNKIHKIKSRIASFVICQKKIYYA